MWHNYGKNGVVLELNTSGFNKNRYNKETNIIDKEKKAKIIHTAKLLMDVMYDKEIITSIFINEINKIIQKPKKNNKIPIQEYYKQEVNNFLLFFTLCFLYKDASYSYEEEIRMVFSIYDKDIEKAEKFRIKNNLIIPYLDISFEENGRLPLKSIAINPEQNDTMFKESIERLLKSYGYDIPVIPSKSKLRA